MAKKYVLKVLGLDCAEEINLLRRTLGKRSGILNLDFDLLNAKMTVYADPHQVDLNTLIRWVAKAGLQAASWSDQQSTPPAPFIRRHAKALMTVLSMLFLLLGLLSHWRVENSLIKIFTESSPAVPLPAITQRLYFLSIFCGAYFVLPKAFVSAKNLRPDINLLMMIAMVGAIVIDQWLEGAMVALLFSIALLLEHWSVNRARRAISALINLSPETASLITTAGITEQKIEQVAIGDLILIKPGSKIPLDGVVEQGCSSVNQAPITGESTPVVKEVGDPLYAGTLNEDGALECRVTKGADETTLARIIHLVQEAQGRRASSEQWVEAFSRIYTPTMILLALLVFLTPPLLFGQIWSIWFYRALVVLVIACPCALVISTPVSIVSGLTSAARRGVLIKGGLFLEKIGRIKSIAVDKTGTLTYGRPQVVKIIPLGEHTEEQILRYAASLEATSEHPLARAILSKASEQGLIFHRAEQFQIDQGKGAHGVIAGKKYWIGSRRFMHEMKQETPQIDALSLDLEQSGHSVVALGTLTHVCGLISIADTPRRKIKEVIGAIKKIGIKQIVMLTGDNRTAAASIAQLTQVDAYYAQLLPEDKMEKVIEFKQIYGSVAMIGDGVNDAPAMAAADIGIAMGAIGSDAAIETADIALMTDNLSKIPDLITHSRRTLKIIKQNISFALSLKFLFLILAVFGFASLWMAIFADTVASLLVVFNALRLLYQAKS